jgi:transposase InsO family protein
MSATTVVDAAESDITYLPMAHGFMYLAAILDVASRKGFCTR